MIKETQLKLTGWYLLIIMSLTLSFSGFVYSGVTYSSEKALKSQQNRIERRIRDELLFGRTNEMKPMPPFIDEETVSEIKHNTFNLLAIINLFILIVTGLLGYFLAGRSLRPIEEMINKQKRFISDAAHEVKTPLTIMKSNLEIANRDKSLNVEKAKQTFTETISDLDQLNTFINLLLTKSKYQNGKNNETFELIDLELLLGDLILKFNKLAENKNITIVPTLQSGKIMGDYKSIEELFTNLIDNAIKYSLEESKIYVKMEKKSKQIVVKIQDEGIGIPQKDLGHIFEPFFRSDESRSKQDHDGFGLGLSIVKDIADRHNAIIKVESEVNKGTKFSVIFERQ